MRVAGGTAKGVPLTAPRSRDTRPVSARSKEALFDILAPRVQEAVFLDLFAGTGAVGIEALSRGAQSSTFVESSQRALLALRANLAKTALSERATVVRQDVFDFLQQPARAFDIVFVGPPQWRGLCGETMAILDTRPGWMRPGSILVAQCDPREDEPDDRLRRLRRRSTKRYGAVLFRLYEFEGRS